MKKQCIVTTSWDDGHILDLRLTALLKKYGVRATLYVCPFDREIHKKNLLTDRHIRILSKNFEIGGHTLTHPRLAKIPVQEAQKEIVGCKTYLEHVTKKPVKSFCYPGGNYNDVVKELVRAAGFRLGRTTARYAFDRRSDPYALPTTFHTYNHFSDIHKIIGFAGWNTTRLLRYTDWEYLAMDLFDHCRKTGSMFHLFGHSWEIEHFHAWEKLERVLRHISNKRDVSYVTNGELAQ